MTQYGMFSDAALKKFREFLATDAATRPRASRSPEGAFDNVTDPRIRRAVAQDRRPRRMARDDIPPSPADMDQPLQSHVDQMCDAVEKAGGDVKQFEHFLHSIWPGVADHRRTLDDELDEPAEDEDDFGEEDNPRSPANPNPFQGLGRKGSEGFSKDMPPPFKGRPTPGGRIVGDAALRLRFTDAEADFYSMFPDAARIGLDPIQPMSARSAAVSPIQARTSRHGLALDAKLHRSSDVSDYEALFGPSSFRVL